MSYIPTYLAYLDRTESHSNGWPIFVDRAAQEWATNRVSDILAKMLQAPNADPPPLWLVGDILFGQDDLPECLRGIALYDARYAVTYRALLEARAEPRWFFSS